MTCLFFAENQVNCISSFWFLNIKYMFLLHLSFCGTCWYIQWFLNLYTPARRIFGTSFPTIIISAFNTWCFTVLIITNMFLSIATCAFAVVVKIEWTVDVTSVSFDFTRNRRWISSDIFGAFLSLFPVHSPASIRRIRSIHFLCLKFYCIL